MNPMFENTVDGINKAKSFLEFVSKSYDINKNVPSDSPSLVLLTANDVYENNIDYSMKMEFSQYLSILKLIETVVEEVNYDLWKDMFQYYEEDYNYDGSGIKLQREQLVYLVTNKINNIKNDGESR